jgi:hypothetical protein
VTSLCERSAISVRDPVAPGDVAQRFSRDDLVLEEGHPLTARDAGIVQPEAAPLAAWHSNYHVTAWRCHPAHVFGVQSSDLALVALRGSSDDIERGRVRNRHFIELEAAGHDALVPVGGR